MTSLLILKYLQTTPHPVTIKTIADEFRLNERSVKRHISRIRKAGFEVIDYRTGSNVVSRFKVKI